MIAIIAPTVEYIQSKASLYAPGGEIRFDERDWGLRYAAFTSSNCKLKENFQQAPLAI